MNHDKTEDVLQEIHRRGEVIRKKHEKRVKRILTVSATVCSLLLVTVLGVFSGAGAVTGETDYGAFLLPAEAGGYVLTAVIAFVLGVLVTVMIKYYTKNKMNDMSSKGDKS